MESYERIDARGVRETGRPVSFVPKGALTHHLLKQAVVALPLVGHVRSPRGIAAPAGAYRQCHSSAELLASSVRMEVGWVMIPPTYNACENPPPAALSQLWTALRRPSSFLRKRSKNRERKTRDGGDKQ